MNTFNLCCCSCSLCFAVDVWIPLTHSIMRTSFSLLHDYSIAGDIDAILVTYPDLKHIGALPYLISKVGCAAPVYATVPVWHMGRMFFEEILQSRARAGAPLECFDESDLDKAFDRMTRVEYERVIKLAAGSVTAGSAVEDVITVTPHVAGHMLGGTFWEISKDPERVVYAVEFNHGKERHLPGGVMETAVERPTLLVTDTLNALTPTVKRAIRDRQLQEAISHTLLAGGDVLLPVDAAGRVLELLLVLQAHKQATKANTSIVFLSPEARTTLDFARGLTEWAGEHISSQVHDHGINPFDLPGITVCSSRAELAAVRRPMVVLATGQSMNTSFAQDLFLEMVDNPNNLILFTSYVPETSPFTLAPKLIRLAEERTQAYFASPAGAAIAAAAAKSQQPLPVVGVSQGRRDIVSFQRRVPVPLEGAELTEYWTAKLGGRRRKTTSSSSAEGTGGHDSDGDGDDDDSDDDQDDDESDNGDDNDDDAEDLGPDGPSGGDPHAAGVGKSGGVVVKGVKKARTHAGSGSGSGSGSRGGISSHASMSASTSALSSTSGSGSASTSHALVVPSLGGGIFASSTNVGWSSSIPRGLRASSTSLGGVTSLVRDGRSYPTFPHIEYKRKFDSYGEILDLALLRSVALSSGADIGSAATASLLDSMGAGASTSTGRGGASEEKTGSRTSQGSRGSSLAAKLLQDRPVKCDIRTERREVKCALAYIDLEGRSDGKSIKNILTKMAPKKIILIHGSAAAKSDLREFCEKSITKTVIVPKGNQDVDVTSDTSVYRYTMHESLARLLTWVRSGGLEFAYADAQVAIDYSAAELPLLGPAPPMAVKGHPAIILGDFRLADLKRTLNENDVYAEFHRGLLVCGEERQVHVCKVNKNEVSITGSLCDDYFRVRSLLYGKCNII